MIGIYKITNTINGKCYIGQSINIEERIKEHKAIPFRTNEHISQNYPLYKAIKKYGLENFTFEVIQECSENELNKLEKYWIETLHTYINDINSNGYNLTYGGDGHQIISKEQIQEIVKLWNDGYATGEISLIMEIEKHAIIRYLKEYSNYTIEESNKRGQINSGIKHRKTINVYNKYGKLIKQYNSVKEAGDELNISNINISSVVTARKPSYYGMFFIEADKDQKKELILRMEKQKPPAIVETNATGNKILHFFFNKDEIKTYLNREGITSIQPCCKGHTTTAYGHYWTYLYKYIDKYGLNYTTEDGYAEEKFK